ncbi:hypothetical protein [Halomarina rubra]|uniref:DUF8118 domain-containing protein n=1 Tax=Halomarina rubra TaxID=2071873 RepID=A0ABD6ARV0_9EURY|nr:hypothetical protein [Halomarina rubra]
MATNSLQRDERAGSGAPDGERPPPRSVTGPHPGYDRYGRLDHYYYRCERCGLESTDAALTERCWRCDDDEEES